MPKICLSTYCLFLGMTFREAILFAVKHGFEGIGLWCDIYDAWPSSLTKEDRSFIRDVCGENGIPLSLHSPSIGNNIASHNPGQRRESIDQLKETILLAEDEDTVRQLWKKLLEEKGYIVLTARDGREAVKIFQGREDEVDLVILDAVMPGMSGRAACEVILDLKPGAKILFCSGYSTDVVETEFLESRDIEIVSKPYEPEEFAGKIREILDKE